MRLLVLLLLLLNVGLFAYFNIGQLASAPVNASREINPEKLIILNQQALDAMPSKQANTTEATPVPASIPTVSDLAASTCYKWGNFTKTNLPAAQVVLARLSLQNEVKQEEVATDESRFWVYYPPLKSAE